MKSLVSIIRVSLVLALCNGCSRQEGAVRVTSLYDIDVETIEGKTVAMEFYRGKVLLIVNTASKCGFTGQYEGLQSLFEEFENKGLVILGFPSNDFLRQEPGTNAEIKSFCKLNYGVTFPMFAKIRVKGGDQHPLYTYLTSKQTNPEFGGRITWNFNKFLIARDGRILFRFGSRTKPRDPKLISRLQAALREDN